MLRTSEQYFSGYSLAVVSGIALRVWVKHGNGRAQEAFAFRMNASSTRNDFQEFSLHGQEDKAGATRRATAERLS